MTALEFLKRAPVSNLLVRPHNAERSALAKPAPSPMKHLLNYFTPGRTAWQSKAAARELAFAALIHSRLMSINLPSVSYAHLKGKTLPCDSIGGDFFDAVALDDSICAVVADVSGKGAPAAIVAAMIQGIIHAQMLGGRSLEAIADMVNEFLCSRGTGKYATMVLLKVGDDGSGEYLNCGHVHPIMINGANTRPLQHSNMVVGLIPEAKYCSDRCDLSPGDRIVICTDGITETENSKGEQYGNVALESLIRLPNLEAIFEHVAEFQAGPERKDDWTILELSYQGRERSAPRSSESETERPAANGEAGVLVPC